MKQAINIRLEKDIVQKLDEYAHELDKTRTSLVEKAIELYFDKLDEMIADKRIDNLKSGKSTVVPLEEVFKKAGINPNKPIIWYCNTGHLVAGTWFATKYVLGAEDKNNRAYSGSMADYTRWPKRKLLKK